MNLRRSFGDEFLSTDRLVVARRNHRRALCVSAAADVLCSWLATAWWSLDRIAAAAGARRRGEPFGHVPPEPVQEPSRVDNRAESVDNGTRLWTDRHRDGRWPAGRMCVRATSTGALRGPISRCPPDVHRPALINRSGVHRGGALVHPTAPHGHEGPSTTSTAWWRWWRS